MNDTNTYGSIPPTIDNFNNTIAEKKKIKKDIRNASNANSIALLIFMGGMFLSSILVNIAVPFVAGRFNDSYERLAEFLLYILIYPVLFPIMLGVFYKTRGRKENMILRDCIKKPDVPISQVVKWIFIGLFLTYAVSIFSTMIISLVETITKTKVNVPQIINKQSNWVDNVKNILSLSFFAPIFEELLFRGTIYRNNQKFGGWVMIVLSGITFGIWHTNLQQTLYTAAMGIFTCFIIEKSGSVIPGIIMHFILNTNSCIIMLSAGNLDQDMLSSNNMEYLKEHMGQLGIAMLLILWILGVGITGLVLFIIELVKNRKSFYVPKKYTELSAGEKFGAYISAPVTIIWLVLAIGVTVFNNFFR